MNKATFLKRRDGTGEGRVYKLDPPFEYEDWDGDKTARYVWVSAAVVPWGGGPETYIFPSTAEGEVIDWGELPGSFKGGLDHAEALRGMGYEVIES